VIDHVEYIRLFLFQSIGGDVGNDRRYASAMHPFLHLHNPSRTASYQVSYQTHRRRRGCGAWRWRLHMTHKHMMHSVSTTLACSVLRNGKLRRGCAFKRRAHVAMSAMRVCCTSIGSNIAMPGQPTKSVLNQLTGVGAAVGLGVGTCVGACPKHANDHPKRMSFDAYGQVRWP
jgi:hypothetical protein